MRERVKKIQYVEVFLDELKSNKSKIIRLNLKRNMDGESHTEYNDISNKTIEKWEKTLKKLKRWKNK